MANWKLPYDPMHEGIYLYIYTYYIYITIALELSIAMFDYQRVRFKSSSPTGSTLGDTEFSRGFGVEEFQQPLGHFYGV